MHVVLERVVSQIANEVRGLDSETTHRHPNGFAYKWTVQQVVEHLALSCRMTTAVLEAQLRKGRPARNQKRTYLQWSLQMMILSFGVLPQGVPALDETMPAAGYFPVLDGRQLGELLRQEIEAMDTLLDDCRRRFGMEPVAAHPWLGPLRVDQWRRLHVVHGLHHVAQLRSVLAQVAPERVPVVLARTNLVKKFQVPAQRPLA
jgi:DinB superfamily